MYINSSRKGYIINLLKSFRNLHFDVLRNDNNNGYIERAKQKLVILVSIALFSNFKLTTSSDKHLEEISHAHTVSLISKLKTSTGSSDDLSIGFDRDRDRRQDEFTNNETLNETYHVMITLGDVLGCAEHQKKLCMV